MNQIKIGRFIADERKRKGYTQKQLSEKLGISDKTISKWERGNLEMENWLRVLLIAIGLVVVCGGIVIACILDREAGAFECPDCNTRFVPDMKSYVMGAHTLTRRKLVCPHCGAHKYCKKVLTK